MVNSRYQCIFPPRASGNSDAREGARAVTVQHATRKHVFRWRCALRCGNCVDLLPCQDLFLGFTDCLTLMNGIFVYYYYEIIFHNGFVGVFRAYMIF